ncbi:2OG-Fe(II) oxygenase [Halobacteriovorax sp. HLS]|uniref:2OG-Fe(II) oxygenase n=1 Tax=Halobacteriovorax sp. HLS TaxID=2234000 RepID=UPI000FD764CB|nr:2OG-Fe(II) oxygenase [Halobacteriovorax sp. HLS]
MSYSAVVEWKDFLSREQCQRILDKRRKYSTVNNRLTDYLVYSDELSSNLDWAEEFELLEQRIKPSLKEYSDRFLGQLPLESISISHIGFLNDEFGEFTELHYDWELVKVKNRDIIIKPFVILVYLTAVEEGGELLFPVQNVKVSPELGKAVIFPCNFSYPHTSMPVIKGSKHVCRITMKIDFDAYQVDELEI